METRCIPRCHFIGGGIDIILGSPLLSMVTAPLKCRIIASEGDDPLNSTPNMDGRMQKQQWINKRKNV
jgi:hypothetical protein